MAKGPAKTPDNKFTPDSLAKNPKVELTEDELSRVSGGIKGESADAKHKGE